MRHMSDALRREIARVLRAEREAAGLSHADLAARAGINAATLARIERGTHAPSLDMVERILAALGVQAVLSTEPLDRSGLARLLDNLGSLESLPFVLDGALAATLQGVPLPIEALEIDVTWADSDR